jgi:hypothetical protein
MAANERTRKSCKQPEVGVYDRDARCTPEVNLVDAEWTSLEEAVDAALSEERRS